MPFSFRRRSHPTEANSSYLIQILLDVLGSYQDQVPYMDLVHSADPRNVTAAPSQAEQNDPCSLISIPHRLVPLLSWFIYSLVKFNHYSVKYSTADAAFLNLKIPISWSWAAVKTCWSHFRLRWVNSCSSIRSTRDRAVGGTMIECRPF